MFVISTKTGWTPCASGAGWLGRTCKYRKLQINQSIESFEFGQIFDGAIIRIVAPKETLKHFDFLR
jgi:hypothetical protein